MGLPILIATPSRNFGEHIQQTLEDEKFFTPVLAQNREMVLSLAKKTHFVLAILDCDLPDLSIQKLWLELQASTPGMRLIVLPLGNDPSDPSLDGLKPDNYLTKPFYAPDLLASVRKVLGLTGAGDESWQDLPTSEISLPQPAVRRADLAGPKEPSLPDSSTLPWLLDTPLLTRRLTRLSIEAEAQAALITYKDDLWAYDGQLSRPAALELAQLVAQDWAQHSQISERESGMSDLVQFARLEATAGDQLLYTTRLASDMLLAVMFDPATPFSRIRSRATNLATALASPSVPEEEYPGASQTAAHEVPAWLVGLDESLELEDEGEKDNWSPEFPATPLFSLDQVPPATPGKAVLRQAQGDVSFPDSDDPQAIDETIKVPHLITQRADEPQDFQLSAPSSGSAIQVAGNPYGIFDLSYSFILIPRLPCHYLTGGLSLQLNEWMRQLSLAFGWRLEHLAIRPEYLFWISRVLPELSAASLVNDVRQQTSMRIFLKFPLLAKENPSGDFWAPTYLAMASAQPPPVNMLKEFIEQTRRQQGTSEDESTLPGDE